MNLLKTSALAAALTGSLSAMAPSVSCAMAERPGSQGNRRRRLHLYGLRIVMNYAVMHEYAVDRNSWQLGRVGC
jgi:hypothetical protein